MTAFREEDWKDWPTSNWGCCSRGALIVYRGGLISANCLEGTDDMWGEVPFACNGSYRMFGEIDRLL